MRRPLYWNLRVEKPHQMGHPKSLDDAVCALLYDPSPLRRRRGFPAIAGGSLLPDAYLRLALNLFKHFSTPALWA